MTVNLVPWPLSPGTNGNMPPICFASASTIFIPRLLHAAGSNPASNPGPASKTENERPMSGVPPIWTMMLPWAYFAAFVTSSLTIKPSGIAIVVAISEADGRAVSRLN